MNQIKSNSIILGKSKEKDDVVIPSFIEVMCASEVNKEFM